MSVPGKFIEHFELAGVGAGVAEIFGDLYGRWQNDAKTAVHWDRVEPAYASDLLEFEELGRDLDESALQRALDGTAWIVLNGGLGTSMKMERAKSLLPVREGRSFLDLIAEHVLHARERSGSALPLIFMNSFVTDDDTREALEKFPDLTVKRKNDPGGEPLPLTFMQNRFPRIREADGAPCGAPDAPSSWAPPGHGDIYPALKASGLLELLIKEGYRWVFVSNADNLGAFPDPVVSAYMESKSVPFMLEVTPKTAADVKGGTLVRHSENLELLEIAQVPEGREADFQDVERFPYFNTNNLWVDLVELDRLMESGGLGLPLIVNRKTLEGVDVVQLEVAMGAAVGVFENAKGLLVSRERFAPVKTTDDLLVRRSDLYHAGQTSPLEMVKERPEGLGPVVVSLDKRFYGGVEELDLRIPEPLSLIEARSLTVTGDVRFGRGVVIKGDTRITNEGTEPLVIEDGRVLEGDIA